MLGSSLRLAPPHDGWSESHRGRPSAVAVIVTASEDLLLILRGTQWGSHRGQLGLPGGRRDAADDSPTETALRELEEEIGIPAAAVSVLGQGEAQEARDASLVVPIVARVKDAATLRMTAAPQEVQAIVQTPLRPLLKSHDSFEFVAFGQRRYSDRFPIDPQVTRVVGTCPPSALRMGVWGLSARILRATFSESLA